MLCPRLEAPLNQLQQVFVIQIGRQRVHTKCQRCVGHLHATLTLKTYFIWSSKTILVSPIALHIVDVFSNTLMKHVKLTADVFG